ncbi:MAG: PQQ-binding-like beta-propeller repeat protein [Thaumarchaeota archaeon]|nr:PQQ-binding-like beta-propeller repeat protein [Nitrososphaerota archaeon]
MSFRHLKERKYLVLIFSLTVIFLLGLSSLAVVPIIAQQPSPASNWNGPSGNYPFNYDYSPQTSIGTGNVNNLQISWIYPNVVNPHGGIANAVTITPVIEGGVVYFISDGDVVTALNLATGAVIWQHALHLTFPSDSLTSKGTPNFLGSSVIINRTAAHYHALWYTSKVLGGPALWVMAANETIYAWDALTGAVKLKFSPLPFYLNVTGNFGKYKANGVDQITIDEKSGTLVFSSSGDEGSDAGRGFFAGFNINVNPPTLLWRSFTIPPQDGSNPNWTLQSVNNMSHAWMFDGTNQIDLKAMTPSQLQAVVGNDWGTFGFDGKHSYAGSNGAWGGSEAVDPATGIAYLATAQPSPDWNATQRPGPNAWSSSIIAVNIANGKFVWAFQTTSHDTWDYDCSWSVILANATINGQNQKVVFKGCKNGYMYALDAATGKMLWVFNAPSEARTPFSQLKNPLNATQMKLGWSNYPSKDFYLQNPPATGGIESDPAYDPGTNTVFVATYNAPTAIKVASTKPLGSSGSTSVVPEAGGFLKQSPNATVWAIDASTGQAKWHYFINNVGFRGGVTVSNGVLYVPTQAGDILLLNANNGNLIQDKFIGALLITEPAIATDSNGVVHVVIPGSGSPSVGALVTGTNQAGPGFIVSLTVAAPAGGGQTTTTTQASQAPSSGIEPTTFYAVVGIAVVFIIATGFLAARRGRKPAP